jgi:hypothetical protein
MYGPENLNKTIPSPRAYDTNFAILSKLAEVVTLLTCIREIPISSLIAFCGFTKLGRDSFFLRIHLLSYQWTLPSLEN